MMFSGIGVLNSLSPVNITTEWNRPWSRPKYSDRHLVADSPASRGSGTGTSSHAGLASIWADRPCRIPTVSVLRLPHEDAKDRDRHVVDLGGAALGRHDDVVDAAVYRSSSFIDNPAAIVDSPIQPLNELRMPITPPRRLEERVAEGAVVLRRAVGSATPWSKPSAVAKPSAIAASRTPSTMAVKVFLVNPSTISGRLASAYTNRGLTWTSPKPAATRSGYSLLPMSASPPPRACSSTRHRMAA